MEIKSKWAAAVFIVMALVLALGMAVVAAPVKNGGEAEAAVQEWDGLLTPTPVTQTWFPGQDVTQLELSPNFATDNTIYAITVSVGVPPPVGMFGDMLMFTADDVWNLRKSTDGGYGWTTMGTGLGASHVAAGALPYMVVDMAVAPDDPNYIAVACTDGLSGVQAPLGWAPVGPPWTDIVYVSSDGGATFSPMGADPTAGNEAITSVAVSQAISGVHQIVVGVQDTTGAVTPEGVYIWGAGTPPSLTWAPQLLVEDVYKVAFSSNYTMDFAIVVVGAVIPQAVPSVAGDTWVHLRDTSVVPPAIMWDDPVVFPGWPAVGVSLWEGSATGAVSPANVFMVQADIALPGDFDATRAAKRVIYVSTAGATFFAAPWVDDVWRVSAATPWRLNVAGGGTIPISSLSHAGNIGNGNLLAGVLGAGVAGYIPDIYATTTPFSGTPMWMSSSKPPTGFVNTQVRAAPDYLTSGVAFSSVMGDPTVPAAAMLDESAVSRTPDFGDTWNQISLVDTTFDGGINNIGPIDADNQFVVSQCVASGVASLWKSAGMMKWERVDTMAVTLPLETLDLVVRTAIVDGGDGAPDGFVVFYTNPAGVIIMGPTSTTLVSAPAGTIVSPAVAAARGVFMIALLPGQDETAGVIDLVGTVTGIVYGSLDIATGTFTPGTGLSTVLVRLSPTFGTDNTVYWAESGAFGTQIRVSQDGGAYFASRNSPTPIRDFVVQDANTLYYVDGLTAAVYKSSDTGHTWPTTGVLTVAANVIELSPDGGTLAVSGMGIVSVCSDTTAHPLTFSMIGMISGAGALLYIAFSNEYDADAIIYVADSAGGVYKVVPLVIEQIDLTVVAGALVTQVAAPSGIAVTDDGTLYVADLTPGNGVWRTMNPKETPVIPGMEPQWVNLSWGMPAVATPTLLWAVTGSNVLFTIDTTTNTLPPFWNTVAMTFTDTLVTEIVTLTSPADGATNIGTMEQIAGDVPRVRVTLEWSPVPDAHQYRIQVDTDPMFHNPGVTPYTENQVITAPETTYTSYLTLLPERKYYWRVRVEQFITFAGASPWSAVWDFETGVGTGTIAPDILGPEHGQQDVKVKQPCFTWGAVSGATEYKFTLKDSAGAVIADTAVAVTSYCYDGELEYETSYVWTVQGTSATTESGVASATFSTEAEAPATPAWVWIVIAIGAVVAIVVIVLIVRTRRPV